MSALVLQNYGILGCLREQYEDLGAACKEEVFKRQAEAANDWRTDKELNEACQVFQLYQSFCTTTRKGRLPLMPTTIAPYSLGT